MAISRSDMEKILGPLDNQLAAEIVALDPSVDELAQAFYWLNAEDAMVADRKNMPTGKVADLVGILEALEDDDPALA